jgi:tRNA-specific adenosine deaminase 1
MAALKSSELGAVPPIAQGAAVRGRNGYENYGAIRTKPGRSDSIPAISFSCSDKIASWNVVGLQGALMSDIVDPVYLDGVVIGGVEKEGGLRMRMRREVDRALHDRVVRLQGR